jgi:DNA modification methylase
MAFGWTNPLLIDAGGTIIAGHGRRQAAKLLWSAGKQIPGCKNPGMAPCLNLGILTEAQRRAYVLADNKIALNAAWDMEMLRAELLALGSTDMDLGLTGFTPEEIAQAMTWSPPASKRQADPDAAPAVRPTPISKPGDLWICGPHRVLCGDATKAADIKMATGDQPVSCVWTDPPYNVAYEGKSEVAPQGSIANDSMDASEFSSFLTAAFTALAAALVPGGGIYVAHADTEGLTFRAAFLAAGLKLSGCLIWRKDCMVMGRSDYQWQHEPILYGWRKGGPHRWFGGRKQTTLLEFADDALVKLPDGRWQVKVGDRVLVITGDAKVEEFVSTVLYHERPKSSADHPTMKPTGLIERMLRNSAKAGEVVLDPFGGSGSTLIASERLGMRAVLLEIDPRFCDVIVRRWQQYSGKPGVLERAGRSFDEIATGGDKKDSHEGPKAPTDPPKARVRKPRKQAAQSARTPA